MTLGDLIQGGMMPQEMKPILTMLTEGYAKIAFCGGLDTGKVTAMKSCAEFFRDNDRVLVVGDINVDCGNVASVGSADEAWKSGGFPDRIIVGEMRDENIIPASMLAESIPGGFMGTGLAGSVDDLRLQTRKMFALGNLILNECHVDDQIASMFDFLAFFAKLPDGRRILNRLVEVTSDKIERYRTIIRFDEVEFVSNGNVRWVYEQSISHGRLAKLAYRGAGVYDWNGLGRYLV